MATKLEEFVARLHADGVEAGRAEAEQLLDAARLRAQSIVAEAEACAAELVASAESRAAEVASQRESELRLAARDAVLGLRSALSTSLEALLRREAGAALEDPAVVTALVKAVVLEYARADAGGKRRIEIVVPAELREAVESALLSELASSAVGRSVVVDVKGGLSEAGFEYRVGEGGTVEMTTEAVLEVLKPLLRPALHQVLNGACPGDGE